MSYRYRLTFECVTAIRHPEYWRGGKYIFDNASIPDEYWHSTEKHSDDLESLRDQYLALQDWAASGVEPIRNVKLEQQEIRNDWEEITP